MAHFQTTARCSPIRDDGHDEAEPIEDGGTDSIYKAYIIRPIYVR